MSYLVDILLYSYVHSIYTYVYAYGDAPYFRV